MTTTKLTPSQSKKITAALAHHHKYRKAYFMTPPSSAGQRRQLEKRDTLDIKFVSVGTAYQYSAEVRCSCANVYYYGEFLVDGEQKTVRAFRKLI